MTPDPGNPQRPDSQSPAVDDGHVEAPAQADPLVGTRLHGRYEVLRELGWGSLGRVYLARDPLRPAGSDLLALKVIRRDRLSPESIAFLKAEFRFLSTLRHPNVTRVHDLDVVPGRGELFFTLDYLPGRPLTEVTWERGWEACLPFFVQTLRALAFVHGRGLVHMDLKPKNVYVIEGEGEHVELLDFHLARERSNQPVRKMRGTVAYMAPEVIRGGAVDHRADLYSFGAVAYEALCGEAPFADAGGVMDILRAQVNDPPRSLSERGARIPPALEAVVLRLLAKDPDERFPSANDVIRALNQGLNARFELETEETLASYLRTARFVGRGRDLERPLEVGRRLADEGATEAPVLLVVGEGGSGKSRFLAELKVALQLGGLPCLLARPSPVDDTPYGPFLAALAELLRRVGREELLDGNTLSDLDGLVSLLKVAPDLPQRVRRTAALTQLVREVAADCPFAFAIDDLADADEGTLELVRALVGGPPFAGLLVLALQDDEARSSELLEELSGHQRAERIELNRLTRGSCGELLGSMLDTEVPESFVSRVWEVTGGNPRFVEETVRSLAEGGALRSRDGGLSVDQAAAAEQLGAASLGALTAQRVARLDEDARRLLAALACSPRARPLPFAAALAQLSPERAGAAHRELERRGFVSELGSDALSGAPTVLVEHDPLRRAALESIGADATRALHARAARLLESRHPVTNLAPTARTLVASGEVTDRAEELLWHLENAGELRSALRYAAEAGEAARSRGEHLRARARFSKARELYDRLGDEAGSADVSHLHLTLRLAEALAATGARREALELLAPLDAPFPRSVEGLVMRASMRKDQGDLAAALADLERALPWAEESLAQGEDDAATERARCLAERASVHLWRADYAAARSDGEQAVAALSELLAAGQPVAPLLVSALDQLHHACHFSGDEAGATDCLRRGLAIQEEHLPEDARRGLRPDAIDGEGVPLIGDAAGAHVPRSLNEAAFARAGRGRDLGAHYEQRARLLLASGDADGAAFARLNRAHLRRSRGQIARALVDYREACDAFASSEHRTGEALARVSLARLLAAGGDGEGARLEAAAAEALAGAIGCRWLEAQALLARAEAAQAAGDLEHLGAALREADALVEGIGNVPQRAELDLFHAELDSQQGDPDAARAWLERFRAAPRSARSGPQRVRAAMLEASLPGDLKGRERRAGAALAESERRGLLELSWRAAWCRSLVRREREKTEDELEDVITALETLRELTDAMPAQLRTRYLLRPDCSAARDRFAGLRGE